MSNIVSVPRINALGLNGPEKTPNILLKEIFYDKINVENEDILKDENKIYSFCRKYLRENKKVLFIGGDHSITYPIGKAFYDIYSENAYLIVFDAHADCMPPMKEPTHEEFLAGLVKYGWNPNNLCLIGVRKIEEEEREFLEKNKIKYFNSKEGINEIKSFIIKNTKGKDVYLSIDIDALDSKFVPGVSYPEKNGLSKKDFFYLLSYFLNFKNLRVVDLVEIVYLKDKFRKTYKLSKKVLSLINNCF